MDKEPNQMPARTPPHGPVVDPHLQRLVAEVAHMATKQSDYATVLQAMQVDMRHVVKNMDALTEVAKDQVALTARMSSHSDAIDRAFRTMDSHKGELAAALNKLSETLDKDRTNSGKIAETVNGYRAQLRLLYLIGSVVVGLLVTIATMTTTSIKESSVVNRDAIAKNLNDLEVLEAKMDRVRISDQLVISEHERRLSRLEVKSSDGLQ